MIGKRHTFEFVQKYFKEQGCKLLEKDYINSKTKMKYLCKCGNKSEITLANYRCRKCGGNEKLTFKFVFNFFKEKGCELLEKKYTNVDTNMNYRCECGNISLICFKRFKNGERCRKCCGTEKLTFDFVYKFFEKHNCRLLENEYKNSKTKMKYKCECGNISYIKYDHFKTGVRCVDCGRDKASNASKTFKEYTFNSGEVRKIQGYENLALDEITKIYKEHDIITNRRDMPEIVYKLQHNLENNKIVFKNHRYYPDIYIKSQNKIIEVKSAWTYQFNTVKIIHKALATRKLGYDFEFWIYQPYNKDFKKIII